MLLQCILHRGFLRRLTKKLSHGFLSPGTVDGYVDEKNPTCLCCVDSVDALPSKRSPPSGRCVAYWKTFCQRPSWKGKTPEVVACVTFEDASQTMG